MSEITRENAWTKIRLNQRTRICFICQYFEDFRNASHRETEKHHIFHGTANRSLADKDGLYVYLCPEHHREGHDAVHGQDRKSYDMELERIGQQAYESRIMEEGADEETARQVFRARYGRSWL